MTTETFARLALALIETSLTNPRKTFDAAKLQELADSIKASGVHQPVLVRPLPGSRLEDTHLDPATGKKRTVLPTHELVAGERRYRASKLAGVADIPAMIRELTDDQVREIQIVENLQRDDLSELEEAEGFQQLMQHSGLNADQVGAKIGRSRAHVYARLKLLDLGSDARAALSAGKIEASTALLVARIPDSKLQAKALKEILDGEHDYQEGKRVPLSHRKALKLVQDNYMLKLSSATFSIIAADLVPAAGACDVCPKRTGAAPDLFSDVKNADVCTDPSCFHKKEEAHAAAQVAAAEAKGLTVIAGKEAQELRTAGYNEKLKGYRRLDSAEDSPTDKPLRKIIGAQMKVDGIKPVLIEDPRNKGEFLECLANETVLKLLKTVEAQAAAASQASAGDKAPKVSAEVQKLVSDKKAKAEAKAKQQYEREWRATLVKDAWQSMLMDGDAPATFNTELHRYLVVRAARNLSTDDAAAICQLLDLGKVSPVSAVTDYARETLDPDTLHLLIIMQEASDTETHTYGGRVPNEGLMLVAGNVFGAQLEQVITEIKGEVKAKIWPKVAKTAKNATAPAAPQEEGAGGAKGKGPAAKKSPARAAKLTAEEATQGIAAAMQGIEPVASAKAVAPQPSQLGLAVGFAIGQVVQVTTDSSKFGARLAMHKWCGKKGTITAHIGKAWDVTFKGRSGGVASFDEDEISLVEGAAA
ncbi:ParB/RepB/Spo0J family partition protein [Rhodoferax sp. TS-BS-61-7]|uniref:ParB/RepB/Spo0J family partition protein n=1 Tax=Rhodoferax sp. TS-BS-61-7 TaxID=2094194 RepID=UPI0013750138|nr:ParB/RepB/Spo0J family partition protein [Rhodoferax sp. TS-BS-61-7]